jgi:putative glycerol-1-phosphate prenyltransferase
MIKRSVLDILQNRKSSGKKSLAVLIDPDKIDKLESLLALCKDFTPELFLVGSSFSGDNRIVECILRLRSINHIPIVLFPGNMQQVVAEADALLLLSALSTRNADLLIGKHVEAALKIKSSKLEVIPTGYLLIESGALTTVQYVSQSLPIPRSKPEITAATALAGEQLGMKIIYLEAGSGANETVPNNHVEAVAGMTRTLLFTGGGIRTTAALHDIYTSGCDVAVIGNILETDPELLRGFIHVRDKINE